MIKNHAFYNFEFKNDPLNGIIRQLTKMCGGNVHKKGVVNVTSSSHSYGGGFDRLPIYAVDFEDNEHYFCSSNIKDSWFQYDFFDKRVCPTYYTIKTTNIYGKKGYNLKSWVILGSNAGLDSS